MPAQLLVVTNLAAPAIILQFLDANGNVVNTPAGAEVAWTVDNSSVIEVTQDPNNALKCDLTFGNANGNATITCTITGANDVNNQPYAPLTVQGITTAAVPARPASAMFQAVAPA